MYRSDFRKSQAKSFNKNGKRNKHGIPLVRIKIMGKEGWQEVKEWKAE